MDVEELAPRVCISGPPGGGRRRGSSWRSAVWIVNSTLAAVFVDGSTSQLSAAIGPREGNIDKTVDAIRRSRRWDVAFDVIRANDLAMLYVMFQKPGLTESVLVIAAAVAISCAAGVRRTRR